MRTYLRSCKLQALLPLILAIADAFDALTSDRSYRKGYRFDEALDILKCHAGTQWDPFLASTFIRLINERRHDAINAVE